MRWWDASGALIPAAEERAEQAELAVQQERQRPIEAELRIQALEARLRELEGEYISCKSLFNQLWEQARCPFHKFFFLWNGHLARS